MKKLRVGIIAIMQTVTMSNASDSLNRKPASLTFERIATCSSHTTRTSGLFILDGVDFRAIAEACSLNRAIEGGKEVCESNNFSWLRPDNGRSLIFKKSTIYSPVCKKVESDYECETKYVVDCK